MRNFVLQIGVESLTGIIVLIVEKDLVVQILHVSHNLVDDQRVVTVHVTGQSVLREANVAIESLFGSSFAAVAAAKVVLMVFLHNVEPVHPEVESHVCGKEGVLCHHWLAQLSYLLLHVILQFLLILGKFVVSLLSLS